MRIGSKRLISMRMIWMRVIMAAAFGAAALTAVHAQWPIGAAGNRDPAPGNHRYIYLVFANPVPGGEAAFNDWYSNVHMGDLLQLPGIVGAQRFRMISTLQPQPSVAGYKHGYLVVWDLEASDASIPLSASRAAFQSGKTRHGAAFNYIPGDGWTSGTWQAMGPRITRADGKGPTLTDPADNKTTRLNRYMLLELSNALPGRDADFDRFADERIKSVLKLPGWLAAQRFQVISLEGWATDKPKYVTMWEAEGTSAQAIYDTLNQAMKSGAVKKNEAADEKTAETVFWEPITPHVTKAEAER